MSYSRRYKPGSTAIQVEENMRREQAMEEGYKKRNMLLKPREVEKLWFVVSIDSGVSRVLKKGSKTQCLEFIAKYIRVSKNEYADVFIAHGFKLIGY